MKKKEPAVLIKSCLECRHLRKRDWKCLRHGSRVHVKALTERTEPFPIWCGLEWW